MNKKKLLRWALIAVVAYLAFHFIYNSYVGLRVAQAPAGPLVG